MHIMSTSFDGKVRDVWQTAEAQIGQGVADMVKFKAQVNGHEATEKANRIQAWQGLVDWQLADRFDRDRPYRALGGVGSTSQSSRVQDGGKSRHAERSASNVQSAGSSKFGEDFHKTQLGRGGRCLACKGGIRKKNLEPQQPLSGMIFTNADPEVCWQIRRQARRRHYCNDGGS